MSSSQDGRVSRRWFLERMAWVSSVAAGGALTAKSAAARQRPFALPEEAYALRENGCTKLQWTY